MFDKALVFLFEIAVFAILAFQVHAAGSICYGSTSKGQLEGGIPLPASGKNFSSYSLLGNQLGRTFLHSTVRDIVLRAYQGLEVTAPQKMFVYGETGFAKGGRFKPHRTHQNGLSVDFMVPVIRGDGQSVPLPTNVMNKFGYGIEFDREGRFGDLSIDFEAMAEHLYQLDIAARKAGTGVGVVIFEPEFHTKLFATQRGPYLKKSMAFMARQAWVRHDEHYHVDFKIQCKSMQLGQM